MTVATKDITENNRERDPVNIYRTVFMLQSQGLRHERTVYGFLAMIGDLGGVTEVIMIAFGFVLYSISEHSFYVTAS